MLKGQAKRDYQRKYMREYMRNRRAEQGLLRPIVKTLFKPATPDRLINMPDVDADGNPMPDYE